MSAELPGLIGDATKRRLFAAGIDNLLAIFVAALAASRLEGVVGGVTVPFVAAVYLGYFLIQEGAWSNTLGKRLFGLRISLLSGERCGWARAAIRTILRVFEVNPILLGGLPAALVGSFTKRHQRVGDLLGGTVVARIDARPAGGRVRQEDQQDEVREENIQ